MTVVYRAIFQDDRDSLIEATEDHWASWLREKEIDADLPTAGEEIVDGNVHLRKGEDEHKDCRAIRLQFAEEQQSSYWTTTVVVLETSGDNWVWVDLAAVRDQVFERPPDVRSPRLVRKLIDDGTARMGTARLRAKPFVARSPGEGALLAETLHDPERGAPLVVFSPKLAEPLDVLHDRVGRAASRLAGIANTWVLENLDVLDEFNGLIDSDLAVFGGAVRTYLPDVSLENPNPWRHRYVRYEILQRHVDVAGSIVGRALLQKAVTRRPPKIYRELASQLPGLRQLPGKDADDYLAAWESELTDHEQTQTELERMTDERDLVLAELDETTRQLGRAQTRLQRLEQQVAAAGGDPWTGLDLPDFPENADGCLHAVQLAREHLDGIVIPHSVDEEAEELDGHQDASTWGEKAWQSLRTLQAYVDAKRVGAAGDFATLLAAGRLTPSIPRNWWTPHESQTTSNNPRFRRARTLPISHDVDPSGAIFMPGHVKLVPGGRPAPRIHVHDDSSGVTGQVHVGYFGDHLDNIQTN